jgi:hypothetical protein
MFCGFLTASVSFNAFIYEFLKNLQTEQHTNLIFNEKAEARLVKLNKRIFYEKNRQSTSTFNQSFHIYFRNKHFKRTRALFIFQLHLIKHLVLMI